jgi:hypothetical protein
MAGLKLESLVRGKRVAFDVAVMAQVGSIPAYAEPPALFFARRQSPSCRTTGNRSQPACFPADTLGVDGRAGRAGRPESSAGVPERRSPASYAGRAVRRDWPLAVGGTSPAAAGCVGGSNAKRPSAGGGDLAGRPLGLRRRLRPQPAAMPNRGTSTASTRGTAGG